MAAPRTNVSSPPRVACPPQIVAGVFLMAGATAARGPIAASMTIVCWGAIRLASPRRSPVLGTFVVLVYVALGVLAFLAQCDAATRAASPAWRMWAVGDAAAAVSLSLSLFGQWIKATR